MTVMEHSEAKPQPKMNLPQISPMTHNDILPDAEQRGI